MVWFGVIATKQANITSIPLTQIRNRIILNQDKDSIEIQAANASASDKIHRPIKRGVDVIGRERARASIIEIGMTCDIYRSKYLASSLEVKDLRAL